MWCVIADDFTGAGDSAVQFRDGKRPVRLVLDVGAVRRYSRKAAAIVVNTDTRFDTAEVAYDRVRGETLLLVAHGITRFFKKIDSTLRGNFAAEIAAVMDAGMYRFVVVAPSAPRNGRTVVDGVCLVDGTPLLASPSARDPFTPAADARVAAMLETRFPGAVRELSLEVVRGGAEALRRGVKACLRDGGRAIVVDAETLADLETVAALSDLPGVLFAGSSGLAEALSSPCASSDEPDLPSVPRGRTVYVVGSVSPTTALQCRALVAQGGVAELVVDSEATRSSPGEERARILTLSRGVPRDQGLLLRTSGLDDPSAPALSDKAAGSEISRFIGDLASELLLLRRARFLFASGGDTAARITRALGSRVIDFSTEILPGLPFGRFRVGSFGRRLYFVSKSGGFGGPTAMADALNLIAPGADRSKERSL